MSSRFGLALCICLGPAFAAPAQPPATRQLIDQLSAKDFKLRDEAMKRLEAMGESALPEIRASLQHNDPETRQRLTQLKARIEQVALLSPKLVSLNVEQRPVGEVFTELARQTGYSLSCTQGNADVVTLRVDQRPFWETVDLICRQTGHGLQYYSSDGEGMLFHRVGQYHPHVCYSGQFRIAASNFHLARTSDLAIRQQVSPQNPTRSESLTLTMQIIGEPKAPLMSLGQPVLSVAEDEFGRSLMPTQSRVYESNYHDYSVTPRASMRQTQVQLLGPDNSRTVRRVAGKIPVQILAERKVDLIIEKIMDVKERKFDIGKLAFEIDAVTETATNQIQMRASFYRNADDNPNDFSWTHCLAQRLELVDAQGQKYASEGFNWETGSPGSVTGSFTFAKGQNTNLGKPEKLIVYSWVLSRHEIDFEFRDLPLP